MSVCVHEIPVYGGLYIRQTVYLQKKSAMCEKDNTTW